MARHVRTAVLGGTFDRLHAGHRALLVAAFRAAPRVGIGLTTDRFLRSHPKPLAEKIRSYRQRRISLVRYLRARFPGRSYWIVPLNDAFGGSVEPGVDILVVSEETKAGALRVNAERRRLGRPAVRVVTVPVQRGSDLLPIAGRRIREGDIDGHGRRRVPVRIALSAPSGLLSAVEQAVRPLLGGSPVIWVLRPLPKLKGSTRAHSLASPPTRRDLYGPEYDICLTVDSKGRATLSASDADGSVGVVRGSTPTPGSIGPMVRRLFGSRQAVPESK